MRLGGMRIGLLGSAKRSTAGAGGPAWDVLVTNDAELAAEIASATGAAKTIALADAGTFTAIANLTGKTGLTLRAQTRRGPLLAAGLDMTNTTGCTVSGLRVQRLAPNSTQSYSALHVLETGGASNLLIDDCEVFSNPLADIAMQAGSSGSQFFQGYSGIGDAGAASTTNVTITNCHIHDCFRGINLLVGGTCTADRNAIIDCYQNPCETAPVAGAFLNFRHNDCEGIWANPTDPGLPHSSTFGMSAAAAWGGADIIGNIFMSSVGRRFAAKGSYAAASGPKFNDTTSPTNAMHYNAMKFCYNMVQVEDSLALEVSLGSSFLIDNNTIVKDPANAGSTALPPFIWHDVGAGSKARRNIVLNFARGTHAGVLDGPNGVHADWYNDSYMNLIARPAGTLGGITTGASDVMAYAQQFTGPFTGIDRTNIIARFTPLPGSRLANAQVGAVGTGYDWSTRSYSSLPSITKPRTTVANGVAPAMTQFDAVNDWLQINASAPLLGWTDGDRFTFMVYVDADVDTEFYIAESNSTDRTIRKMSVVANSTSNRGQIRFRFKDSAGAVSFEIDTEMELKVADGAQLFVLSGRASTYEFNVMRGHNLDPFVRVTTWTGNPLALTRVALGLMGQSDTTPPSGTGLANAKLGLYWEADQFIDLTSVANLDKIVALDGLPVDWGANGSAITGTQPRGFVKGNAAALNAGGGINLGSSAQKFVMNGAVVDA